MHTVTKALCLFALTVALGSAQTPPSFTTIYSFQGAPSDAESPYGALTRTANGTLFGTAYFQDVFELTPPSSPGGSWSETVIATLPGPNYFGGVVLGSAETFYGTIGSGGEYEAGAVYQLTPPTKAGGAWTNSLIYSFSGGLQRGQPSADGGFPTFGVISAPGGILYGNTSLGGASDNGTIFEVTPPASPGGTWTETVLYSFPILGDAGFPYSGLALGPNGSLYGSTYSYGDASTYGTVYELTPPSSPGGSWTFNTIYSFTGGPADGSEPFGTPAVDSNGVVYGVTYTGGANSYGTVYSLTPPATLGGAWTETILHSFDGTDGAFPVAGPVLGSTGTLFGSTQAGPSGERGTLYALEPPSSPGGAWTLSTLHRFDAGTGDVQGSMTVGAPEVFFGVTVYGGTPNEQCPDGCGTVFRLTP
jgi:uncharacterized repeat protein (TIGR03803 family)